MTLASVDIVVPVLNEERAIERSLSELTSYLSTNCAYDWCVTVVDNGSRDRTWSLAGIFAATNDRIRLIRLDRPGRGGALKAAWSSSTADVVAYMDVDLSTGLESLRPLLEPIVEEETDVSIGCRLARESVIDRSVQRDVISRIYNVIARRCLGYRVRDAQCGFKAIRSDVARDLVPLIQDDGWFFDTELLVLAWRAGLRINEIPVRWVEDDDSRVRIITTALDDLRGIWRLSRAASPGARNRRGDRQPVNYENRPPAATEEEHTVDFDVYANEYEDAVDQSVSFTGRDSAFYARRKVEILESIVQSTVGRLERLSVLDVGCGTGTTDRFLRARAGSLCGVDVSEEMLTRARSNVRDVDYRWYDGEKLPFPDESFDAVVAICVLHHVPLSNRFKFVNEMVRVTRSNGTVAIFEHNPVNPLTRHAVNTCELDKDAVLLPSRETLALLEETAEAHPRLCNYLFSPFGGALGRGLDRRLHRLPLGGQYAAWVQRPVRPDGAAATI